MEEEEQLQRQQQQNQISRFISSINKKSTTIKNSYLLLCVVIDSLLYYLPLKKIYFSQPITCIELKQLIVSHKKIRDKFGMIPCLEKLTILINRKTIKSSEFIGILKDKMYIEVKIKK